MAKRTPRIEIARAYDVDEKQSAYRVLVDRLWPRGVAKDTLKLDQWVKDLAPSAELRKWFNHRPERWVEFRKRYFQELSGKQSLVAELAAIAKKQPVLLIFGARDEQYNNAVALREYLLRRLSRKRRQRSATKR